MLLEQKPPPKVGFAALVIASLMENPVFRIRIGLDADIDTYPAFILPAAPIYLCPPSPLTVNPPPPPPPNHIATEFLSLVIFKFRIS